MFELFVIAEPQNIMVIVFQVTVHASSSLYVLQIPTYNNSYPNLRIISAVAAAAPLSDDSFNLDGDGNIWLISILAYSIRFANNIYPPTRTEAVCKA